jgi:hypothetical protein
MTTINSSNSSPTVIKMKLEYPPEIIEELDNSFQRLRTDQEAVYHTVNWDKAMLCMAETTRIRSY